MGQNLLGTGAMLRTRGHLPPSFYATKGPSLETIKCCTVEQAVHVIHVYSLIKHLTDLLCFGRKYDQASLNQSHVAERSP